MSEIGLHKIFLFPDKLKKIMAVTVDEPDLTYPITVELSLTNACNLNCVWCSDAKIRSDRPGEMDLDVLKKLVVDLADGGCKGITIEGGGEPTVYSKFREFVEFAHASGISLGLITNGVSSDIVDVADKFEWIRVSVDATTREEYVECKGVDAFDSVMENVGAFVGRAKTVGVGFIVTSMNMSEPRKFVKKVRGLGVDYVHFRPVVDAPGMVGDFDSSDVIGLAGGSFSVMCDAMVDNRIRGNAGAPCRAHSLHSVVVADGSVWICGRLNVYNWWSPIGNLNDAAFRDIWHGETRRTQSAVILQREFCSQYCPECRITKYNNSVDRALSAKTIHFI